MRLLLALALLLSLASGASAQYAANCPTYNTTAFGTYPGLAVITNCSINAGKYDIVLITATGETSCTVGTDASLALYGGTGPYPDSAMGANFNGSIAGTVLTVPSMVTPYPQFKIVAGQTLYDNKSGAGIPNNGTTGSTLTIVGQVTPLLTGESPGGVGRYNVSASVTVASELMWALSPPPPSGRITLTVQMEQGNCAAGKQIVTITGVIPTGALGGSTFFPVWALLTLTSEDLGTGPASSSWEHGQITIVAPTIPGPGAILQ
jgi:hypothetical protein